MHLLNMAAEAAVTTMSVKGNLGVLGYGLAAIGLALV